MDLTRFKKIYEEMKKPQEVVEPLNLPVLVVDFYNLYLRCFASSNSLSDDGDHAGGLIASLFSLGAVIRQFQPSRVIVVADGVGGSQRRKKLYPEYKAHRQSMTRLNRVHEFKSLEEEKEAQKWQLKALVSILRNLPVTFISQDLVEADDVIAYIAQTVESRGGNALISSTDKDFLQLVNENIKVWSPVKKKLYTPPSVVQDYQFHPNNFLLYRMVTGDQSDGIKGVEGIKEKTLLKFFPELALEEKKDLAFLFESANAQASNTKKIPTALQNFIDSKDILERNYNLMRLDDVAMSGTTRISVLDQFDKPPNEYNKLALTQLFNEFRIRNAFPNYETWLTNTWVPLTRWKFSK